MYADRVAAGTERSVKERLNRNSGEDFGRSRQINNKRQRPNDDKWEHDLFEDDEPRVANHKVGARDLRLKLQKKNSLQVYQSGKGTVGGGVRDLREMLSGTVHSQLANTKKGVPPKSKSALEVAKSARKSVPVEASPLETENVPIQLLRGKRHNKRFFMLRRLGRLIHRSHLNDCLGLVSLDEKSVEGFLQSLGLEKYRIILQAEEIDMTALMHMTDEDLKALGVPMGPRKKILLALDSRA